MAFENVFAGSEFDFALSTAGDDILSFATLPTDQLNTLQASSGIDAVALLGGNDRIEDDDSGRIYFGNRGNDIIIGNSGNDTLFGGKDADSLEGGAGDDRILGDLGDDTLSGGAGLDTLTGGGGIDAFQLAQGEGSDIITDFESGSDKVLLPDGVAAESVSLDNNEIRVVATNEVLAQVAGIVSLDDLVATTDSTDDGTTDDGMTDGGTTDDGTTDDGMTDGGMTDDGMTDGGMTDDGGGSTPPPPPGGLPGMRSRSRQTDPLAEASTLTFSALESFVSSATFESDIRSTFGQNVDVSAAKDLMTSLVSAESVPTITVLPSGEIGGAEGAYAGATDTIYISQEVLATNDVGLISSVLTEEVGHYLDDRLNSADTPGDEGLQFAMRLQGQTLDETTLNEIQGSDDRITVEIDGQLTELETGEYSNRWYVNVYDWQSGSTEQVISGKTISNRRSDGKTGFLKDWGAGAPITGNGTHMENGVGIVGLTDIEANPDYFMNQMWTQDDFQAGQQYEFRIRADDGFLLAAAPVNGGEWQFVTPWEWQQAYGSHATYTFTPQQSGEHWLYALHYEATGDAYFDVSWSQANSGSADNLKMPLPGGLNWQVTQSFAGSFSHGDQAAIDFGASTGSRSWNNVPILAAAEGQVIHVGKDNYGYGNHVKIDHDAPYDGTGLVTLYAHFMNSPEVYQGQWVEQGDKLGIMGATGWATGTHLHFEVFQDGDSRVSSPKFHDLTLDQYKLSDYAFSGWGFEYNNGYPSTNREYSFT
ncbi:peptidoglycan DD-metalloendopeptidase family protein [Baaleninema sp.]|uniref:peptidoglycan DD-metalloendopeptidase family protein n=1 Tax=Baaleninema sp. TaxID=3101197 RepID=UPI003D057DD5